MRSHRVMLYDNTFMTVRGALKVPISQIFLQHSHFWVRLTRFAEVTTLLIPQRWFIRYGDAATEAQLQLAHQRQCVDEYSRARLSQPAHSYLTERQLLQQNAGVRQGENAFLELVMGFSCSVPQLQEKSQHLQSLFQPENETARWKTHIVSRPDDLACHTPLNQRLLRANFDLCQWFTLSLLQLKPKQLDQVNKQTALGMSLAVFQTMCSALELQPQEQMQILTFGRQYLAQYLEVAEDELRSDPAAPRRVNALVQLEAMARNTSSGDLESIRSLILNRQWLSEQSKTGWFFFPESLWMQYHWLNSFVGIDLIAELALVDAMVIARGN